MHGARRAFPLYAALFAGMFCCAQSLTAQAPLPSATLRPPVGEQLPSLPSRFWTQLIGDAGRLPMHERLVVIATDGRVLAVADGRSDTVLIPEPLLPLLESPAMRVVLAHNHPANTSLSGADLEMLDHRGVERVVALGNDGSVFEAVSDGRFDVRTWYRVVEARVLGVLPVESARAGAPGAAGFDHFSHLVASILGRAGVIDYRARMSATLTARYFQDAEWLDRVVSAETSRLSAQLRTAR